jgi:hypothetical protein
MLLEPSKKMAVRWEDMQHTQADNKRTICTQHNVEIEQLFALLPIRDIPGSNLARTPVILINFVVFLRPSRKKRR